MVVDFESVSARILESVYCGRRDRRACSRVGSGYGDTLFGALWCGEACWAGRGGGDARDARDSFCDWLVRAGSRGSIWTKQVRTKQLRVGIAKIRVW